MKTLNQNELSDQEKKLVSTIEDLTDGKVVELTPQIRWRPAWFARVERAGEMLRIYVRGDRVSDVMPFPNILEREAKILGVLEKHGIPVPHVYGMCEDPRAIIMEDVPGTRDVSTAPSDEHRRKVARQYVEALAAMHSIPAEEFGAVGLDVPSTPDEIALAGIRAYRALYDRVKVKPDPLIEFSIRWLSDNVPQDRHTAGFIQFDGGQFLFDDGGMTCLYDFEFGVVGEPLADLGTMGGRHSVEPMGDDIPSLCRHYEQVSGRKVDPWVVHYQQAVFLTCANMQFVGCIQNPKPGDPHDVYTEWDMGMRHNLLLALGACMEVTFDEPAPMVKDENPSTDFAMLSDLVQSLEGSTEQQQAANAAVSRMVEYMAAKEEYRGALDRDYREDVRTLMGACPESAEEIEKSLEAFVRSAPPERDKEILKFLYRASKRRINAVGHTRLGGYGANVRLELIQ